MWFREIRLTAALAVLLSHCYPLTGHADQEPLSFLTHGFVSLGDLAVYIFFIISGYLVTQSWLRDPSVKRFMIRRSLRIFPALILVIIGSVFLLGPAMTRLSIPDYFNRRETWSYLDKILIYPAQYGLPGVFDKNSFPNVVNGSLWSLRPEFALYIFIAAWGFFSLSRYKIMLPAFAFVCMLIGVSMRNGIGIEIPFSHEVMIFCLNAWFFFMGAAATQFISPHPKLPPKTKNDYSYGIYLWSFPIQQTVICLNQDLSPLMTFILSLPFVLMTAWLSWHLLEKWALSFKPWREKSSVL